MHGKTNHPCTQRDALQVEFERDISKLTKHGTLKLLVARCEMDLEPCTRCPTMSMRHRTARRRARPLRSTSTERCQATRMVWVCPVRRLIDILRDCSYIRYRGYRHAISQAMIHSPREDLLTRQTYQVVSSALDVPSVDNQEATLR